MSDPFFFRGKIPASKSIMNRLLICQTYSPELGIDGDSQCDDVVLMKKAVSDINKGSVYCGSAGTVLRFLACKVSRLTGEFYLNGSERLLSRPQSDLIDIMQQLGVSLEVAKDNLCIRSSGWVLPRHDVVVDRSKSSQFLSGLLLNCWDLDKDICFTWKSEVVSDGYLQMTIQCLRDLGMNLDVSKNSIFIPKNQNLTCSKLKAESDLSSAFAVAALAAVGGEAHLQDFPFESLQPDRVFVEILKAMNVPLEIRSHELTIKKAHNLKAIDWNLNNCPDLFPVLAVLCSAAEGTSHLYGAPHLGYKESDRLNKTAELLKKMEKNFEIIDGGMCIEGSNNKSAQFLFDTDEDHRLAFAAGLSKCMGYDVEIINPQVVSKSFPEYWEINLVVRHS